MRKLTKKAAAGGANVVITLAEAPNAAAYEVNLPSSALAGGGSKRALEIRTPLGTISATSDLLSGVATGAAEVSLSIAKANRGTGVDIALKADGTAQAWRDAKSPLNVFMPYAPTAAELNDPAHMIVWYTDAAGARTAIASGKYDAERKGMIFDAEQTGSYDVQYVHKTFDDIQRYVWAQQAIEQMASRGIIQGTTAETFNPGSAIKRADFIVLLVRTLGLKAEAAGNFADVAAGAYYAEAVAVAKALGITQGTGANQFKPSQSISRQEMMVLIDRAMQAGGRSLADGAVSDLDRFKDGGAIPGYAQQSVANLVKSGLVQGKAGGIDPTGQATRAEIAVLIERLYRYGS
ncbi:S-layer homology domain-containing protein [Cohnella rhizosphaerae]|uniref:S-layer homology domain-containing protein n=1 Tax=Cohnella rhizosphaerae TaxID=1457232 RepID=A0A9X4QYC7_9BACL|nr:S-layer homology domain-containing protein [Cohnella rhizosphaerae]MDG0814527.1 S-layer homology domain-containing protein [Cohnella rhizosphaerae]